MRHFQPKLRSIRVFHVIWLSSRQIPHTRMSTTCATACSRLCAFIGKYRYLSLATGMELLQYNTPQMHISRLVSSCLCHSVWFNPPRPIQDPLYRTFSSIYLCLVTLPQRTRESEATNTAQTIFIFNYEKNLIQLNIESKFIDYIGEIEPSNQHGRIEGFAQTDPSGKSNLLKWEPFSHSEKLIPRDTCRSVRYGRGAAETAGFGRHGVQIIRYYKK